MKELRRLRIEELESRRLLTTFTWEGDTSSLYDAPTNWDPIAAQPPGITDTVIFDSTATQGGVVLSNRNTSTGTFIVRDTGILTDLSMVGGGVRWSVLEIIVGQRNGEAGSLVIDGGRRPTAVLAADSITLGSGIGGAGELELAGTSVSANRLTVGSVGSGALTVFDDATLSTLDIGFTTIFADEIGSQAQADIQGRYAAQNITIGNEGNAFFSASSDAFLTGGDVVIANADTSTSQIMLSDDAFWELGGSFEIARGGIGSVMTTGSAAFEVGGAISIAMEAGSFGTGVVDHGASWTAEDIVVGIDGAGALQVLGGDVTAERDFIVAGPSSSGTGFLEVAEAGSLSVGRNLSVGTAGDVRVTSEALVTSRRIDNSGNLRVLEGGLAATRLVNNTGGTIIGSVAPLVAPVPIFQGVRLINLGTIIVGQSPGIMVVESDFRQGSTGVLQMEIGGILPGEQHDVLQVNGGQARLGGTIDVSLIDGFSPEEGDNFIVLQADEVRGKFDNLPEGFVIEDSGLPGLQDGLEWFVTYGDFDGDSSNEEVVLSVRRGVVVEPSIQPTSEDGTTTAFTVNLDTQPNRRVRVPLRITDPTEGLFVEVDRRGNEQLTDEIELIFDDETWNTPQTVTVVGVDDAIVDGDQDHLIEVGPITRGDRLFRGLDPEDIFVTNLDNDGSTNSSPEAVDDTFTAQQDTGTSLAVLDNDSDPDDDDLTIVSVTNPSNGTAVIDGDTILYTPNAGHSGSDSFEYTISDGNGGEDTATVTVTVNVNVGTPSLNVDDTEGAEDSDIDLDIAADTTDPGDTLTINISGVPDDATLSAGTKNPDGTYTLTKEQLAGLTLTPPTHDADDITLTVTAIAQDGNETAQTSADLTVTVNAVADEPSLNVSAASGSEDVDIPLDITVTLVDDDGSETLSIEITGVPSGASLNNGSEEGGVWTLDPDDLTDLKLTPAANSDTNFTLTVKAITDEDENSSTAEVEQTLQVTVAAVADAPTLSVQPASGDEDTDINLIIDAELVDTDNSESLSITISNVPSGATLSAGTNQGSGVWLLTESQLTDLEITPPENFNGSFTLLVTATATEAANNDSASTSENLEVTVAPVNDDPTADDDSATTQQFESVDIDVLDGDADVDGDTLMITSTTNPSNGSVSINDNGTPGNSADDFITYTPTGSFTGTDSFTYTISDGNGGTATADVTVTVEEMTSSFAAPLTSQTSSPTVVEEDDGDIFSLVLQHGPKPKSNGVGNSQAAHENKPEPPGQAKKTESTELDALDEVLSGDLDEILEDALS